MPRLPRRKVRSNRQAVRRGTRTVRQQVSRGRTGDKPKKKLTGSVKRRSKRTA